jgi:uncharacterized Fe-S cluster-containing radical SAM superfamily protein
MTDFPKSLALITKAQWEAIVELAFCGADPEAVAKETGVSGTVLKQKFSAIRYARESGWAEQAIVALGQSGTLRAYIAAKKNGHREPERMLRWRVSRRLADAVMSSEASEDQEEPLVSRLVRVAKLRTSNEIWEFLLSIFSDLSDKDIEHLAGMEPAKRKK